MKILLNQSDVIFDEENHKYYKEVVDETTGEVATQELQGITSTIIRWAFPNTYAGVPQEILDKAAEHGSHVHTCIEMSDIVGATADCPESQQFLDMMAEHGMEVITHEYIVTAYDRFASPIDVVMQDKDGNVWLGDIKTTSSLLEPKVRLQLSIYALWFEQQNPHLKVKGIVEIWLPKEQYRTANYNGWKELPRTSAERTDETVVAYMNLYDPTMYAKYYMDEEPEMTFENKILLTELMDIEKKKKELSIRGEQLKAELLMTHDETGWKKLETSGISVCWCAPSKRTSIDSAMVKKKYPEAYKNCLKTTETKASLRITLK